MEESERDEILRRLNVAESRLAATEARLAAVEQAQAVRPPVGVGHNQPPVPPPIARPVTYAARVDPAVPKTPFLPPNAPQGGPQVAQGASAPPDAEYQIGAQILPKVGAVVVIIALAYLVSLAVGRGLLTPAMLWWGVNMLALVFIGVGQWKRNEAEEFGAILTAIGSCGLYLNFAAGHVFQHLYAGESLVAQFVGLSAVNLIYAYWRSSKVFLGLGLVGGLLAALMPLDKGAVQLNVALTFLILVPSVVIAAKRRWFIISATIWAVGTSALIPIAIDYHTPNTLRVAAILGVGILTITGYARALGDEVAQEHQFALAACLTLNGLMAFLCLRNPVGSIWMVGYAVAILASIAIVTKNTTVRRCTAIAAVLVAGSIAPFGFWLWPQLMHVGATIWLLMAVSLAFAFVSRRYRPEAFAGFGVLHAALALLIYLMLVQNRMPLGSESVLLLSLIAVLSINAWAVVRARGSVETFTVGGAVLVAPILARLIQVNVVGPTLGASLWQGIAVGATVAAALAIVLSAATRWKLAAGLAITAIAVSFAAYGITLLDAPFTTLPDAVFTLTYGAMVCGAALAFGREDWADIKTVRFVATMMGGLLLSRFGYLILTTHSLGWQAHPAAVLALAIVALIGAVVSWRLRLNDVALVSALFACAAASGYGIALDNEPIAWAANLVCCVVLMCVVLFVAVSVRRSYGDEPIWLLCCAAVLWALTSQLSYVLLSISPIHMKYNASLSAAWIFFAVALLIVGFSSRVRELRLMAFFVLFATVVKVFLADLSALDPAIRVAVLLLLGIVMIGGGYWYIRTQPAGGAKPADAKPADAESG